MSGVQRLAVFIDYQNAYRGARQGFGSGPSDPHVVGQFDPFKLAELIATRQPPDPNAKPRELVHVSVYRGLPGARQSPTGHKATQNQIARWNRTPIPPGLQAEVYTRPLDYRTGEPREKGIDVVLALDLAFGAANGEFEVVVLLSGDSDLLPALERAAGSGVLCETAAWVGGGRRLPSTPYITWTHFLGLSDFAQVRDSQDYR